MTLREAREIWARKQSGLAAVDVQGWKAEILRDDLEDLSQARFEQPLIRLLSYFDTFLLGHREREHVVALEHQSRVYRPQGWIAPVLLINGRVNGVWEYALEKNYLRVQVTKFKPISRQASAAILDEARDLARFLNATDLDVQIH